MGQEKLPWNGLLLLWFFSLQEYSRSKPSDVLLLGDVCKCHICSCRVLSRQLRSPSKLQSWSLTEVLKNVSNWKEYLSGGVILPQEDNTEWQALIRGGICVGIWTELLLLLLEAHVGTGMQTPPSTPPNFYQMQISWWLDLRKEGGWSEQKCSKNLKLNLYSSVFLPYHNIALVQQSTTQVK